MNAAATDPDIDLGTPRRALKSVGSTMAEARVWAHEGAPHGALVLAEEQAEGRGRRGRRWVTEYGKNLLMTLVLRPVMPEDRLTLIPLVAGLAVATACDSLAGHRAEIKWPNDVLIDDRKVAGVLVERSLHEEGSLVLLGIGLNVNQTDFDETDAPHATSLSLEFGSPLPRSEVLKTVLAALNEQLSALERGASMVVNAINRRLAYGSERVTRVGREGSVEGIVRGVRTDGSLHIESDSGDVFVYAGDVKRPERQPS